jgi:glycosyltransferase involved in cell wall biosynthesis
LNILIINYEYPPIGGGAGNASSFLAKSLKKRGHEVVILTSAFRDHSGYSLDKDCHLYRIKTSRKYASRASSFEMLAYAFNAFLHLKTIIKKHEITHCIAYFSIPFGPLAWYMKVRWGIPYINSLRGGDVPGLVNDLNTIHKIITPIRRLILSSAIASIANAEGLANLSRKADPQKIDVIPNGVDADYYQPMTTNESSGTFNFVFVGRFHDQKNIFYLLNSFKNTIEKHKKCHLHLIGDGSLNDELKAHANKLELSHNLSWHGWLNKEQLKAIYQKSDCMINPSHYEGLPNTVLEGMACALPVIVSNVPGNNDLITQDYNGLLFEINDQMGLTNCMNKMIEACDAKTFGGKGRERVLEKYTWDMVAEMYEGFLNKA